MSEDSLIELATSMRRGERTCLEVLEPFLERIAEREPVLHAWAWFDADAARHNAMILDAVPVLERRGALFGVPVGIKDIFDTADMPTEFGSPVYRAHRPKFDAACVAALRAADAIVLGKTATTEFAASAPAATVNPHDPRRTPGGSSSGSAAAVADGMVPAALGSQTAGSVIRPAAFCGTVGYKPTFNTLNRRGMSPLSEFTDTIGVLSRSVRDAAELVGVMARRDLGPRPIDEPPRIAVCRTAEWPSAEPATRTALARGAEALAAAGADVESLELPAICDDLFAVGQRILCVEASLAFAHEYNEHRHQLSDKLRALIETGLKADAAAHERALEISRQARAAVDARMFTDFDAILTPSAPGAAPIGTETTGSPAFNHVWTLLHLPCITLPAAKANDGMPLGLQLVGARRKDRELIAVAKWSEDVFATR